MEILPSCGILLSAMSREARSFVLEVSVDKTKQQIPLTANVIALENINSEDYPIAEALGWLAVLIIVVVLGILVAKNYDNNNGKQKKLDEDIYSYY